MLRTQEPAVYDQWVTNEMPFNDPAVIEAINEFGWFLDGDRVSGGREAVASVDFRDSPKGLFDAPPQCMMHRQASFIPAYFPEGTEVGADVDFFYFPAYAEKDLGTPVLGAGTLMAITDDSEATRGLMQFFQTAFANEIMMSQGAFLTPLKSANPEAYADDTVRAQGEILTNATTFRFDGSDLMPGGVGAGSFWTGMVDFAGGKSAEEVTQEIQDSWDALK
jgi:alpha-glucoside transport system substrate-binding protein